MQLKNSAQTVTIAACSRIDLLGGTLDIWPMYLFFPGASTVNVAIDRLIRVTMRIKQEDPSITIQSGDIPHIVTAEHWEALSERKEALLFYRLLEYFNLPAGIDIVTENDIPRGSGLGGSSSLLIAAILCFLKLTDQARSAEETVALAKDLEARAIRVPTGIQDYYPPLYGGLNCIRLEPGSVNRQPLTCDLDELERRLVLCYSGQAHFSGSNNWSVFKSIIDGNRNAVGIMHALAENSKEGMAALGKNDFSRFACHVDRDWSLRKELIPAFSTEKIEQILRIARQQGAVAGKACGAGGGGCVALVCGPGKKKQVIEALGKARVALLDFSIRPGGQGWQYQ